MPSKRALRPTCARLAVRWGHGSFLMKLSHCAHGLPKYWPCSCAGTVSAKPIVMRAEYAYCPNLTIIDTPGFILKVRACLHAATTTQRAPDSSNS